MFGLSGGETQSTVARNAQYHADAQARWLCLSTLDLSRVKNSEQLAMLVKVRYGIPQSTAQEQVESWSAGREF